MFAVGDFKVVVGLRLTNKRFWFVILLFMLLMIIMMMCVCVCVCVCVSVLSAGFRQLHRTQEHRGFNISKQRKYFNEASRFNTECTQNILSTNIKTNILIQRQNMNRE
jgi:fatty-acid desaturase